MNIYRSNENNLQKADAAIQLSNIYASRANFDSASNFLNVAFEIFYNHKLERKIMDCYMQLGIIESYKSNYTSSANYFLRSLLYAEKENDTLLLNNVCINLASVYSALEEYKKAKYYLLKIKKADLNRNFELHISYLGNLGQIEFELGRYEEAFNYLKEGIRLFGDNSSDLNLIQFYILAGECALKLNLEKESLDYYNKSLLLINANDFPIQYAHINYGLAQLHKKSDPNRSLVFSDKSLELASQFQIVDLLANNYKLQADIYETKGDYRKSLKLYKLYQKASDSIYNDKTKKDIEVLEANFQVQKSKNDLEKLTLINERNSLKYFIYIAVLVISISIALLLFFILRKRNIMNAQLSKSNKVKDKLLSIIAHDLRSPLHNLVTVLDGVKKKDYSADELDFLITNLNNQTLSTIETLDNLLKWGQTQLRGTKLNKVEIDLRVELTKLLELYASQLIHKQIKINYHQDADYKINFDKDHFDFILRNFVANAIKFSFENSTVYLNCIYDDVANSMNVMVKDNGIGIKEEELSMIFTEQPIIKRGTKEEKGTGLALSLCHEFALINGAKVSVKSEVGKGSTFLLIIPL